MYTDICYKTIGLVSASFGEEVQEMTQKRVDFVRGSSFIDAFSIVEWPDGAVIRGTLADFTRRVGLENLITWLTRNAILPLSNTHSTLVSVSTTLMQERPLKP